MAKYLITGSYTAQGTKGVLHDGGSGRKAAVEKGVEGLGGKVEAMYYAFGETDVVLIVELPDAVSALALSLVVNASDTVTVKATPLITVEEVDAACRKTVAYRPAGAAGV